MWPDDEDPQDDPEDDLPIIRIHLDNPGGPHIYFPPTVPPQTRVVTLFGGRITT